MPIPRPSTAPPGPPRPACPGTPIPRLSQPGQGGEAHSTARVGRLSSKRGSRPRRLSQQPLRGNKPQRADELVERGATAPLSGTKTTYDYDPKGNLLKKTDAAGTPAQRITELTTDAQGRKLTETRKGGTVTLPNGATTSIPDATWSFAWDQRDILTQVTDPEGNVTSITPDAQGNPVQTTDPNNQTWQASFTPKGQLLTRTDPLGNTTQITYNKTAQPTQATDPEAHTTRYTYDPAGRLKTLTDPLGNSRRQTYDTQGQLIARTDEAGASTQLSYTLDGQLSQSTDPNGNTTAYTYSDGIALPTQIQYPSFTRRLTYDARGRNTRIEDVLPATATPTPAPETTLATLQSFDKRGNLTQITDRTGQITSLTYDALGRLTQVTDPLGGITKYAYDPSDNLLAVQDAQGNQTTYTYDKTGKRTQETRPLGGQTTYAYDPNGNLTQVTDPKGNTITYAYDAAGRRVGETHTPAGNGTQANTPSRTITYASNKAGALTGYSDSQSQQTNSAAYTLDALYRRTQEVITTGNHTYTTQTTYAATGRKASFTWPDGTQASYTYDPGQGLKTLTLGSQSLTVQESRWNQPSKILLPGGSNRQIDTDALLRPTRIRSQSPGSQTLQDHKYTYDPESNITRQDTDLGAQTYQYDALYRLTQAEHPTLGSEKYTYDKVGNRLTDSRTDGLFTTNTWSYDQDNKLTQGYSQTAAAISNTWDQNGSLTKQTSADSLHNQSYIYDASNRLTEVKDSNGNTVATYAYDPFGRRISKTIYRENNQALATPRTTNYLYADEGLIAEADGNGTITTRYGWSPDGLWGTDPILMATRRSGADPASSLETFFYLNDHLGTPRKVIDPAGNIVWEGRATAFGETQVQAGNLIENNLRFPGQYEDKEKGTYYNYFRDCYDPATGRYCQPDPIGTVLYQDMAAKSLAGSRGLVGRGLVRQLYRSSPQFNHPYSYVSSNPLSWRDPLGLFGDGINAGGDYLGHSDFVGHDLFLNYLVEDHDPLSSPYLQPWRHFRDLPEVERDLANDLAMCNKYGFGRRMHQGQDYFSHYRRGYRAPIGHLFDGHAPDHNDFAWDQANAWSDDWVKKWKEKCECQK